MDSEWVKIVGSIVGTGLVTFTAMQRWMMAQVGRAHRDTREELTTARKEYRTLAEQTLSKLGEVIERNTAAHVAAKTETRVVMEKACATFDKCADRIEEAVTDCRVLRARNKTD